MGYAKALEAAGAKVIQIEEFGSYQGDWYALVEYEGKRGWIHSYYGSCSGCDAFEGEFGFQFSVEWLDPVARTGYIFVEDERHSRHLEYKQKLAAFGKEYLEELMTQDQAESVAAKFSSYGCDDEEPLKFVRANPV